MIGGDPTHLDDLARQLRALGAEVAQAAERIDALLTDKPLSMTGLANLRLRRESDVEYTEIDNGKTYQLDYNYIEGQGAFDMKVSGLSPKQQQDAVNIATSGLSYFACPDGKRGKIMGLPIYVGKKWTAYAQCG